MAERIAIVEDERLVRELVAVNLRHAGYEIVSAENFDEGKKLLAGGDYQLAILDVMLPGGDGFALTRHARDSGIQAPILMLSARSDTVSMVRGLDAGAGLPPAARQLGLAAPDAHVLERGHERAREGLRRYRRSARKRRSDAARSSGTSAAVAARRMPGVVR